MTHVIEGDFVDSSSKICRSSSTIYRDFRFQGGEELHIFSPMAEPILPPLGHHEMHH
jgi:hypothetical protein